MMSASCLSTIAANSAIAAFCIVNRRTQTFTRLSHQQRTIVGSYPLALASSSDDPATSSDDNNKQDWFADGREAARQLKLDLGIITGDDDDEANSEMDGDEGDIGNKFAMSDEVMESGRAAARELLRAMMEEDDANENSETGEDSPLIENDVGPLASADEIVSKPEAPNAPLAEVESPDQHFSLPSRKSHCMTICLVPPPEATKAWEQLTDVRRQCKDPGFFRWPPHSNILYPFLEPVFDEDGELSKDDQQKEFRAAVAQHLSKVAETFKPFDVILDSFGTFGGKNRGVLWAYPKSQYTNSSDGQDSNDDVEEEPLITLHRLLEEQFPACTDTRKTGAFHPHITLSHYVNNDDALAAKEKVGSSWEPVSFHVPEIYLLERRGDDGQFKIAGTIPFGAGSEVKLHDPPIAFPAMPNTEEEWVREERMAMKDRRKKGNRRRKRSRKSKDCDNSSQGSKEKSIDNSIN